MYKEKSMACILHSKQLYDTEYWAVKKQYVSKVNVAEMRMLRWMCGKTMRDKIRNEQIRKMIEVAPIEEKIRENRLQWFGHIQTNKCPR